MIRRPLSPATRALLAASAAVTGLAAALAIAGLPRPGLFALTLALAGALTVLAHLVCRETRR